LPGVEEGDLMVKFGEMILACSPFVWGGGLLVAVLLWRTNHSMLRKELYLAMQGKKISEGGDLFRIPFLDRLGKAGTFINLEVRMILRSKRLRSQLYSGICFILFYFMMINSQGFERMYFNKLLFTMFVIGWLGLIMAQYMFTAESSYFDGLMTRNISLLELMKGKYILYVAYSVLITCILTVLVFLGSLDLFFLIASFFYTIGFLFFLMFQNAVYNKSFFDHSESGMFNWKGTSGNMMMISMLGMFLPVVLVLIIKGVFNDTAANYFMLVTGLLFTLTSGYWLKWTYNRFLKRRYKNMEGFRSNT